ncbi:MAG: DUF3021 domain-containing protein [Ruminiclostridium sp.]|nr:DUF3021 domain-containing protein [Ruminiclostridium sp.]
MIVRTLKRAGIGYLLGMAVGNLIAYISVMLTEGGGAIVSQRVIGMCGGEAEALLLQSFLSGFIGFAGCAGMTFYEMEEWSLLRIMSSHLAVIFAVFLPVSYALDWMGSLAELLIMSGCMIVSYFIVWLIMCAIYRSQVKELNDLQQQITKPGGIDSAPSGN